MHGDPRMMMHGDPRMGHGDPRMMFGCRPRWWMFRHMMQNAASSEDEKSASDREEKANKRCQMREKRQKFRRVVQEMGVHPWMCRMLAYQMYGKKAGSGDRGDTGSRNPRQEDGEERAFSAGPERAWCLSLDVQGLGQSESSCDCSHRFWIRRRGSTRGSCCCRRGKSWYMQEETEKKDVPMRWLNRWSWTSDSDSEALTDGEKECKEEENTRRKMKERRKREGGWEKWWGEWDGCPGWWWVDFTTTTIMITTVQMLTIQMLKMTRQSPTKSRGLCRKKRVKKWSSFAKQLTKLECVPGCFDFLLERSMARTMKLH